jgi:hypothetical protein
LLLAAAARSAAAVNACCADAARQAAACGCCSCAPLSLASCCTVRNRGLLTAAEKNDINSTLLPAGKYTPTQSNVKALGQLH